ncbi:MAG: thioredoxin family protein, partial [Planctomycetota bacterium]
MPFHRSLAAMFVALGVIGGVAEMAVAQHEAVKWETDLGRAKESAQASGKLLLLHFWTDNCVPCMRLDAAVFNQPSVAAALDRYFVPVKLHSRTAAATTQALGVTRFPTDVVMTTSGEVLAKMGCSPMPMEYVARLNEVATAHASKSGSAFQLAAANSPYGPVVNQAYASLAADLDTPAGAQAAGAAATAASVQTAPPAARPAPVAQANPYATLASPQPAQPAPAAAPIAPAVAAAGPSVGQQAVTPAPEVPAGAPPLGFEGYCAVTMKKQWQWQKGDPQFGVIHRGKTYLFAGVAEKDAFFKDPDAYAPVLSGVDPVLALEQGRAVPGQRQFALEYEGNF